MRQNENRRDFIRRSVLGSAVAGLSVQAGSAAISAGEVATLPLRIPDTAAKGMPLGKLGNLLVSRIFIGCNQVSGYSHGRDLRYLPELMRAYQTDERVLDTWQLCEESGINTLLSDPFPRPVGLMKRYRKERRGAIQWISEVHPKKPYHDCTLQDMRENLKVVLDNEPSALYVQGGIGDSFVMRGAVSDLGEFIEDMKATGKPSGVGAHSIETVRALIGEGAEPDFFMKTYHSDDYWSATPVNQRVEFNVDSGSRHDHDNIWCIKPSETREVMGRIQKPWIAFKVLAAGALEPGFGFKFAFEGGADFICVGMFDFHIRRNVETVSQLLSSNLERARPWCA